VWCWLRRGGARWNASNLLKPMLARGELRCIGATTSMSHRQHIEKDPALERRFQQVVRGSPRLEDTISDPAWASRSAMGPPRRTHRR